MEYIFSDKLSALKPSAIREIFKSLTDPSIISFAAGNPNPLSFPVEALAKISADIFASDAAYALQYGITEGYAPLRESIAARIYEKFGIGREFDQTIVTTGGQQGIELACKAFCNEGDAVICENPSFIGALNAFRSNGARTIGVPLRADGIDLTVLEETLRTEKKAKLLYLIPTFQNPSGITSTLKNRRAVYALAKKYGVVILEDNPYGELRFRGEDIPTFKSMDEEGIVIYNGSYSKVLSAGMRIGFLMAQKDVLQRLTVAKQFSDCHTNIFFQIVTDEWLKTADVNAHIAKIRKIYRDRCDFMLKMLDEHMDKRVTYTRPDGGLFLWCTLPEGCDSQVLADLALRKGVAFVPGRDFMVDSDAPCRDFRLNFSTPTYENMEKGILRLCDAVSEYLSDK